MKTRKKRSTKAAFGIVILPAAVLQAIGQVPDRLIKPITVFDSSVAAMSVKDGNAAFLAGKFGEASKSYDQAALSRLDWFVPWTNGALAQARQGRLGNARSAENQAKLLGDRTDAGQIISAEIDLAKGQYKSSGDSLYQVLFDDPNDPYGLLGQSKLEGATAHLRQAERLMWQAIRLGTPVLLDSDLSSHVPAPQAKAGPNREASVQAGAQSFSGSAATIGSAGFVQESVGTVQALQQSANADAAASTGIGDFIAQYRHLESERPGSAISDPLLPTTPGSALDFTHVMAGFERRVGDFTFHVNYRSEQSQLRATSTSPWLRDNLIDQWIAETRYDSGRWMAGAGYSLVDKNSPTSTPAIEPLEAIFPQGVTNLYNGYAVYRADIGKEIRVTGGAVITSAGGTANAALTAELAAHLIGARYARIGVRPGINRVGTNLGPINMFGNEGQENPIDRAFSSADSINRDASMPELNGRETDAYLSVPLLDTRATNLSLEGSLRQFTSQDFLGGDPRLTNQLLLTPVNRGQIGSLGFNASAVLSRSFNASLTGALQSSNGRYRQPTMGGDPNQPVASSESRVPNAPNFKLDATVDWSTPTTTVGLTARFVGRRIQALPQASAFGTSAFLREEAPATSIDLHFSTAVGHGSLTVDLLNLAGQSFYQGFGGARTLLIGFGGKL